MSALPVITTERLRLRPFEDADARAVKDLAGDRRVAETTLTIPHPYEEGMAETWIATHEASWDLGRGLILAITLREGGALIGAIGLSVTPEDRAAELGYWVGVPHWGRGYCTEAARALVEYGFAELGLGRIHSRHFARNVASGRVLEKAGMTVEGFQPAAVLKWDRLEDLRFLAIERAEWERQRPA